MMLSAAEDMRTTIYNSPLFQLRHAVLPYGTGARDRARASLRPRGVVLFVCVCVCDCVLCVPVPGAQREIWGSGRLVMTEQQKGVAQPLCTFTTSTSSRGGRLLKEPAE